MKRLALLLAVLAVALPLCLGQPTPTFTINISPTSEVAGGNAFTLMVWGQGLFSYSQVYWNTNLLTCTWTPSTVGPGWFDCSIPASYIASPGTAVIHAETPVAGAPTQYSNNVTFTILYPLVITTTSPLLAGTVGAGYSTTLAATGGLPPYAWWLTGGELPPGLELDVELGVISGTPTVVGTFNFTVEVSDYFEVPAIGALRAWRGAGAALAPLTAQRSRDRGRRLARTTPDRREATATRTFSLTINPRPTITTTSPLPTSTVGVAYSTTLAATGGTPPLSWSVSAGVPPPGLTLNASSGVLSGTPTQAGTFNFTAQVSDRYQATHSRAFALTINARPTITTTSPLPAFTVGVAYSTTLAATGGTLPLSWSVRAGTPPPGLTLNSSSGVLSGTPTQSGTFNFTAQVRDNVQATDSRAFAVTINARPTITTTAPLPAFTVGAAHSTTLAATGGTLPLSWSVIAGAPPPGLTLNASSGVLGGTPTQAGTFNFTAQVRDNVQATDSRAFAVTINPPLAITTTSPLPTSTAGIAYSRTLAASGGTLPLSWSVSAGSLPPGLTLNPSSGVLSGTPTTPGTFSFTARAADSASATASRAFSLTINPPVVITTTSPLPGIPVTARYSFTLAAEGGTLPYTWSVIAGALPPGFWMTPSTGTSSGVPAQVGTFNFTAQVTDSVGATASRAFALPITPPPLAIITSSPLPTGTVGIAYSVTLGATGGLPRYSWSVSAGALPPGLALDGPSGEISGTPTAFGMFDFTAQVEDGTPGIPNTARRGFTLTILPPPLEIVTTSPLPRGTVGTTYSVTLAASGGTPPYGWAMSAGSLPSGLVLNSATGAISGTPAGAGTFNFTAQVTDRARATASRGFALTINPPELEITTRSPLAAGTVGKTYSLALGATGGTPPYAWSVSAGSLPSGLALNSTSGEISGTPSTAGTFNFTAQVTDRAKATASRAFALTINPPELEITTASPLAAGTVGTRYSVTLAATGGIPPYAWSVSGGLPPPGLSLNGTTGAISGTPTTAGRYSFTAQVSDSAKAVASKAFALTINPAPLTITTASLAEGAFGSAYSQALAADGGVPPYTWGVAAGSLPAGLSLNPASGAVSGTLSAGGTFNFTALVTDSVGATATRGFAVVTALPPAPPTNFPGLGDAAIVIVAPAQQPRFQIALGSAYPLPITGQVTLTFTPDAVIARDDPAVQFASGGRTATFTIPANSTAPTPEFAVQTGTVAGTILVTVSFQQAGTNITPAPAPSRTIRIDRLVPSVAAGGVRVVRTATGFEVQIIGFSTPRQVTRATFRFTSASGADLQGAEITVPVESVFTSWYQDAASTQFGSQFRYVQPFTVQGDANAVTSVMVTLTNAQGSSQPVTVNF